jgi:hypothetical protein
VGYDPEARPLRNASSFFIGVAGAFVVYMLMFRDTRIQVVFDDPANHWKTAVFDLVLDTLNAILHLGYPARATETVEDLEAVLNQAFEKAQPVR